MWMELLWGKELSSVASNSVEQCNQKDHTKGSVAVGVKSLELGNQKLRMWLVWLFAASSRWVQCSPQRYTEGFGALVVEPM